MNKAKKINGLRRAKTAWLQAQRNTSQPLSPQKSAAFCDVCHVTRRGYGGLYKTSETAPIHLTGPIRLGLAGASSERENAMDRDSASSNGTSSSRR
jgi:hypothetical protein